MAAVGTTDPGYVGLGSYVIDKSGHGCHTVQHAVVHVDIKNLRSIVDLEFGNFQGGLK